MLFFMKVVLNLFSSFVKYIISTYFCRSPSFYFIKLLDLLDIDGRTQLRHFEPNKLRISYATKYGIT
jgi:hypothetical protein